MHTETITWHEVAEEVPDDDTTVLICNPEWPGDPVGIGYLDGEYWREAGGFTLDSAGGFVPPIRWAHLPIGECKPLS